MYSDNNWNKHFDKSKETHSEEQDSNETDNLKMLKELTAEENGKIYPYYQKSECHNYHRSRNCKILNLSNVPLTQDEIDILNLGLSFPPKPKQNIDKLKNEIFPFTRKLRLAYH